MLSLVPENRYALFQKGVTLVELEDHCEDDDIIIALVLYLSTTCFDVLMALGFLQRSSDSLILFFTEMKDQVLIFNLK